MKQLEEHLAQLKDAHQAERPLAARFQSAVDRATVKKAALKAADDEVTALQARLEVAGKVRAAAAEAAAEAEQNLEQLQQQLADEAAAAGGKAQDPGPAAPKTFGELVGEVHAIAAHTSTWLAGEAQAELESALFALNRVHWAIRGDGHLPPVSKEGTGKAESGPAPGGVARSPSATSHRECERHPGEEPSRKAAKLGDEATAEVGAVGPTGAEGTPPLLVVS